MEVAWMIPFSSNNKPWPELPRARPVIAKKKSKLTKTAAQVFYSIPKLGLLKHAPKENQERLFIQKIRQCSRGWEYCSRPNLKPSTEVKRATLSELVEHIGTNSGVLTQRVFSEILLMFGSNVFRALPPSSYPDFDPEEDEPVLKADDNDWHLLQLVYEVFIACLVSQDVEPTLFRKLDLDQTFVRQLLNLFDSEIRQERDFLKVILYKMYSRRKDLRSSIRKEMSHIFYQFIYETQRHNGMAELLDVCGLIIGGFTLPLKEEHMTFLTKVLLPMHKVGTNFSTTTSAYQSELSYCVIRFLQKDPNLIEQVIKALLRFWPKQNSSKELAFLDELEHILNMTDDGSQFQKVMIPLFNQLAKCASSQNFQVAHRCDGYWKNDHIMSLINDNASVILPMVVPVLLINCKEDLVYYSKSHWSKIIKDFNDKCMALRRFEEMDEKLFAKLVLISDSFYESL